VAVLPPPAAQAAASFQVTATYAGDTTHAASMAAVQFSTAALLAASGTALDHSCSVLVINPNGGGLTSFGSALGGTYTASMTVVAADAFGLIPPAPGSSDRADNGTQDTTCVVDNAHPTVKRNAVITKAKHVKTTVIGKLKKKLQGGRKYKLSIPLNKAGKRLFKLQKKKDKAYLKHHHGKHLKLPHLRIRLNVTFAPTSAR
jgi:hypothetical protein